MSKSNDVGQTVSPPATITKRAKHRSPNYPFINLEKAIERAKQVYDSDRKHDVPVKVACTGRWGYTTGGSQGDSTVAALKSFGLIEVTGTGDERKLRISDRAHRILLGAPDAGERIKDAAISPAIHAELWQKYGTDGMPANDVIRHYLVLERNFNEDTVDSFISHFKETISFAKFEFGDKIRAANTEVIKNTNDPYTPKVGDLVQWESSGVLHFPEPKRITEVIDSDHGIYVKVEGSATGIPGLEIKLSEAVSKVDPVTPVALDAKTTNLEKILPPSGIKQYVMTTDTGDVLLRWPAVLSEEDYNTVESWLDGMKRKVKRSVTDSKKPDA